MFLTREKADLNHPILIWVIATLILWLLWLLYGLGGFPPAPGQAVDLSPAIESSPQSAVTEPKQDHEKSQTNSVVIELFYRSDSEQSRNAKKSLEDLQTRRTGIKIKAYDVLEDKQQLARLWQLSKRFGRDKAGVPSIYLFDSLKVGFADPKTSAASIEELFDVKAYTRPACRHCQDGKLFLDDLSQRWPAIQVSYFDVTNDVNAINEMQRLVTQFRVQVPSFPLIKVAGRVVVGFQSAEITGSQIESLFQDRSVDFPKAEKVESQSEEKSDKDRQNLGSGSSLTTPFKFAKQASRQSAAGFFLGLNSNQLISFIALPGVDDPFQNLEQQELGESVEPTGGTQLPEEIQVPEESQLPDDAVDSPIITDEVLGDSQSDSIETAWFGRLSVSQLGLPLFTFLVGLLDGFNPCAMWVLVFLLSVLVSIKDRKKILLVAGTFIVVSGLAYFLFITAWFNVFQLIGLLRPVQIGLGVVAIFFGLVNVKDFFAFHKGLTLSIPESAKPGIYRRIRKIVTANQLTTALSGAIALAIVVNIVELLCTAGLPALYTQILTLHDLPLWKNYAYLVLYILAYMLDDAILVGIVVITLSNRRLQESEGRWLKLLSGSIILLLGIVMIFWPEALV